MTFLWKYSNKLPNPIWFIPLVVLFTLIIGVSFARAETLTASWYSVASLKKEGTFKYSKGVMANGKLFKDEAFTCATRDFKLGETLKITSISSGKSVVCEVTDRISKRFKGKRIDLSRSSMEAIGGKQALIQGLIKVKVERMD